MSGGEAESGVVIIENQRLADEVMHVGDVN